MGMLIAPLVRELVRPGCSGKWLPSLDTRVKNQRGAGIADPLPRLVGLIRRVAARPYIVGDNGSGERPPVLTSNGVLGGALGLNQSCIWLVPFCPATRIDRTSKRHRLRAALHR